MIIECTKKLTDFIGAEPITAQETDPLFTWTANLITVNRRKTLVAINNGSKCRFILYGLTKKSLAKLPELIIDGVRGMMKSEYIAPEIIEKYLDDCGRDLTIVKASRSGVSYCNKACERIQYFSELFEPDDLFQVKYLPWINDDIATSQCYFLTKKLLELLEEKYGAPVQSAQAAELEVTLKLLTPCKRTLVVPTDINFYQLHNILQSAFEWKDEHLHQFVVKRSRGIPTKIIEPAFMDDDDWIFGTKPEIIDSTKVTVREIFEKNKKIEYEYDFGDDWIHTVELKRFIENCNEPYPHCIEAVGDAPMEDCGGMYGFADIMQIMDDPKHPEYKSVTEWVGHLFWSHVSIDIINGRLDYRFRRCVPVL